MRVWGKEIKDNHLLRDVVISTEGSDTRTHKIFQSLEKICLKFDLSKPIWLDNNISDLQMHRKTRFTQDSFIETIPFDYLEFQIIEED